MSNRKNHFGSFELRYEAYLDKLAAVGLPGAANPTTSKTDGTVPVVARAGVPRSNPVPPLGRGNVRPYANAGMKNGAPIARRAARRDGTPDYRNKATSSPRSRQLAQTAVRANARTNQAKAQAGLAKTWGPQGRNSRNSASNKFPQGTVGNSRQGQALYGSVRQAAGNMPGHGVRRTMSRARLNATKGRPSAFDTQVMQKVKKSSAINAYLEKLAAPYPAPYGGYYSAAQAARSPRENLEAKWGKAPAWAKPATAVTKTNAKAARAAPNGFRGAFATMLDNPALMNAVKQSPKQFAAAEQAANVPAKSTRKRDLKAESRKQYAGKGKATAQPKATATPTKKVARNVGAKAQGALVAARRAVGTAEPANPGRASLSPGGRTVGSSRGAAPNNAFILKRGQGYNALAAQYSKRTGRKMTGAILRKRMGGQMLHAGRSYNLPAGGDFENAGGLSNKALARSVAAAKRFRARRSADARLAGAPSVAGTGRPGISFAKKIDNTPKIGPWRKGRKAVPNKTFAPTPQPTNVANSSIGSRGGAFRVKPASRQVAASGPTKTPSKIRLAPRL